jgi:hypothetical protein
MTVAALSLLLLTLGAEPAPTPELLPETPPDWRFERIDFPLSFAPELKYEGFEELRFAPGMFDAESDTYFTYIFALKITSKVTVDAANLKSLFETYYRGLCRTVVKETGFKFDLGKVKAVVREDHYEAPSARHFSIAMDSFDPFVTGKPLRLNLEMITIDAGPSDHRIFAAVSPKPLDDPIWKLLRKLKRQFQRNSPKRGK